MTVETPAFDFEAAERAAKRDAQARAELGQARALQAAQRRAPDWRDDALEAIRRFALERYLFLAEDVRKAFGEREGVNPKAWGPIFKLAEKQGLIEAAGYAPANSSNRSPKCRWRSRLREAGP